MVNFFKKFLDAKFRSKVFAFFSISLVVIGLIFSVPSLPVYGCLSLLVLNGLFNVGVKHYNHKHKINS